MITTPIRVQPLLTPNFVILDTGAAQGTAVPINELDASVIEQLIQQFATELRLKSKRPIEISRLSGILTNHFTGDTK